jgi:hypothetical protein
MTYGTGIRDSPRDNDIRAFFESPDDFSRAEIRVRTDKEGRVWGKADGGSGSPRCATGVNHGRNCSFHNHK